MTDEEQKKLERRIRKRTKTIKAEMLADLRARGLVPKEDGGTGGRVRGGTGGRGGAGGRDGTGSRGHGYDRGGRGITGDYEDDRDGDGLGLDYEGRGEGGEAQAGRGTVYVQMVEDYIELWATRAKLEADIAERGVTVMDYKRGLPVENCSVSARVRVSKQMTTIVQSLGYKDHAVKARRPEVEDDEL